MEAYPETIKLYEEALGSAGMTQQKFGIYTESLEAKQERLIATIDKLKMAFIDSGDVGRVLDTITNIIDGVARLTENVGGLNVMLGVLGTVALGKVVMGMQATAVEMQKIAMMKGMTLLPDAMSIGNVASEFFGLSTAISTTAGASSVLMIEMLPIIALLGGITYGIYRLATARKRARQEFEGQIGDIEGLKEEAEQIDTLIGKYDELSAKKEEGQNVDNQLLALQKDIASQYPELIGHIDDEGNAYANNLDQIKEYSNEKKELLKLQLEETKIKGQDIIDADLTPRLEEAKRQVNMYKEALDSVGDGPNVRVGMGVLTRDDVVEKLKEQQAEVIRLSAELNEYEQQIASVSAQEEDLAQSIRISQAEIIAQQIETASSADELAHYEQQLISLGFTSSEVSAIMNGNLDMVKGAHERLTEAQLIELATVEDLDETTRQAAINRINNEKAMTEVAIGNARARIRAIQAELQALAALGRGKGAFAQSGKQGPIEFKDLPDNWAENELQTRRLLREQEQQNQLIASNEKYLKDAENALANLNKLGAVGSTKGVSGGPKGKKKKTKKPKKKKEEQKAEYDRYHKINLAIDDNSDKLRRNTLMQKQNEDNLRSVIFYKEEQIKLMKEEQRLLNQLNIERRKERQELESQLSKQGFKFSGEGDARRIVNPEIIEGQSKETEKLFKRYTELNKIIPDASNKWWEVQNSILDQQKAINDAIEDTTKKLQDIADSIDDLDEKNAFEKFVFDLDEMMLALEPFSYELDLLADKYSLLGDSDYDTKADLLAERFKKTQSYSQRLRDEFDSLANTTTNNSAETNELISRMTTLQQKIRQNEMNMIEYGKAIDNLRLDKLMADFDGVNKRLEQELGLVSHNLSMLEGGLLSGTDIEFADDIMLPTIPEDLVDKQIRQNMEMLDEQERFEEAMQRLKEESLEQQRREQEESHLEQMQELVEHFQEILSSLSDFLEEERMKESEHQLDVWEITTDGLESVKVEHITTWEELLKVIKDRAMQINGAINSINNVSQPSQSSGGGGGGSSKKDGYGDTKKERDKEADYYSKHKNEIDKISKEHGSNISESIDRHQSGDYDKKKVRRYATGTKGHDGKKKALVGEEGYELGILPSGKTIILGKRGAELVDLPKGTEVIPHYESKEIISHTGDIDGEYVHKYKDGTRTKEDLLRDPNYLSYVIVNDGKDHLEVLFTGEVYRKNDKGSFDYVGMANSITDKEVNNWDKIYKVLQQIADKKFAGEKTPSFDSSKSHHILGSKSEALGQYYMGGYDKDLPQDYGTYRKSREKAVSQIDKDKSELRQLEQMTDKGLDDINAFREIILQKINDQLAIDIDMQHRINIDTLEQQSQNAYDYMQDIKGRYEVAIEAEDVIQAQKLTEAYNRVSEVYLNANQKLKKAIKDRYESEFGYLDKLAGEYRKNNKFIQHSIDMLGDKDHGERYKLTEKLIQAEGQYRNELKQSLVLAENKRNELELGSYEWNVMDNIVSGYRDKIMDSEKATKQMTDSLKSIKKDELQAGFSDVSKWAEYVLFDGKTADQTQRELEHDLYLQGKYIDGREKQIKVDEIRRWAKENEIELSRKHIRLLETEGAINKNKLTQMTKELEIQQLQNKLDETRSQKTIQELKQLEDGTWQYEYVADRTQIYEIEQELAQKELELLEWQREEENNQREQQIQDRINYLNRLEEITQKGLNGQYSSSEEFIKAIHDLNQEFISRDADIDYISYWKDKTNELQPTLDYLGLTFEEFYDTMTGLGMEFQSEQDKIKELSNKAKQETGRYSIGKHSGSWKSDQHISNEVMDDISKLFVNQSPLQRANYVTPIIENIDLLRLAMPKNQTVNEVYQIDKLEFPNVESAEEIKKAINSLPRIAKQKARER